MQLSAPSSCPSCPPPRLESPSSSGPSASVVETESEPRSWMSERLLSQLLWTHLDEQQRLGQLGCAVITLLQTRSKSPTWPPSQEVQLSPPPPSSTCRTLSRVRHSLSGLYRFLSVTQTWRASSSSPHMFLHLSSKAPGLSSLEDQSSSFH